MTLNELEQVATDINNGVIVSKQTWMQVLMWAITLTENLEGKEKHDVRVD